METQKLLKPADKVVIVSDYREKKVIENLKKLGATVNEQPLEVGDFICSENVAVERKSYDDFISSIIDGRLFDQAENLKKNFIKPIIIIEGYSNREFNDNSFKAAVASLIVDFNVSLLSTRNEYETAKNIFWIAKKEQSEKGTGISIRVGKKPKDDRELIEFIFSSLPGVSTKTAGRIIDNFNSPKDFFSSSEKDMEKILGKKKGKGVWKILNTMLKKK
ncbi:MAG: ERCC4 domain-containing protein [Candidatus Aenigmatarchaeota archaeon]